MVWPLEGAIGYLSADVLSSRPSVFAPTVLILYHRVQNNFQKSQIQQQNKVSRMVRWKETIQKKLFMGTSEKRMSLLNQVTTHKSCHFSHLSSFKLLWDCRSNFLSASNTAEEPKCSIDYI